MYGRLLAPVLIASSLLLAGCSATPSATPSVSATSVSETPTKAGPVSYSTVEDLKDAFVSAGGDCADWTQDDHVTNAAQSGTCSDDDTFMTFADDGSKSQTISDLKQFASDDIPTTLLVGPNWIINSEAAIPLASKLGGTVVTYTGG